MLLLLATVGGLFLLTRADESEPTPPPPAATQPPSFALTDSEAISRFQHLDQLRLRAYRQRDASLLTSIFTSDGPLLKRVRREIALLISSDSLSRTRFETKNLTVLSNEANEIRLKQQVVLFPRVLSEGGKNLTKNSTPQRQVIEWTLRLRYDRWLMHSAVIVASKPADKSK